MGHLLDPNQSRFSLNLKNANWLKIFATENLQLIISNPVWLWYCSLVLIGFSFGANGLSQLPFNEANVTWRAIVVLNIFWLLYAVLISLSCSSSNTNDQDERDLRFVVTGVMIIVVIFTLLLGAAKLLCTNSHLILNNQLAWLAIIALPFFILLAGNLIYTLSAKIKLD